MVPPKCLHRTPAVQLPCQAVQACTLFSFDKLLLRQATGLAGLDPALGIIPCLACQGLVQLLGTGMSSRGVASMQLLLWRTCTRSTNFRICLLIQAYMQAGRNVFSVVHAKKGRTGCALTSLPVQPHRPAHHPLWHLKWVCQLQGKTTKPGKQQAAQQQPVSIKTEECPHPVTDAFSSTSEQASAVDTDMYPAVGWFNINLSVQPLAVPPPTSLHTSSAELCKICASTFAALSQSNVQELLLPSSLRAHLCRQARHHHCCVHCMQP